MALHYVFNCPEDKIVWDVGHQAYGHKVLTGRRDRMKTIRQSGGLSGALGVVVSHRSTSFPWRTQLVKRAFAAQPLIIAMRCSTIQETNRASSWKRHVCDCLPLVKGFVAVNGGGLPPNGAIIVV